MFSGDANERVLKRKTREVMNRIKSAREAEEGIGRMGTPCIKGAARTER